MDIRYKLCKHPDKSYKMLRLFKRVNGKFIPCSGTCPDCGQMAKYGSPEKLVPG